MEKLERVIELPIKRLDSEIPKTQKNLVKFVLYLKLKLSCVGLLLSDVYDRVAHTAKPP